MTLSITYEYIVYCGSQTSRKKTLLCGICSAKVHWGWILMNLVSIHVWRKKKRIVHHDFDKMLIIWVQKGYTKVKIDGTVTIGLYKPCKNLPFWGRWSPCTLTILAMSSKASLNRGFTGREYFPGPGAFKGCPFWTGLLGSMVRIKGV